MTTDVVLALEEERWASLIGNDFDRLDELLHPELRYTHSNAMVDTKESYLASVRGGVVDYRAVDRGEASATTAGNTVLIIGQATFTVTVAGNDITITSRYSAVWVFDDDQWRFFAWHNTPVPS